MDRNVGQSFFNNLSSNRRECVSTGAAGAQTRRSLGYHLLHLLILRLLVLCAQVNDSAALHRLIM